MKYKAMYLKEKRKNEKLNHLVQEAFVQGRVSTKPHLILTWQQAWIESPVLRELEELKER